MKKSIKALITTSFVGFLGIYIGAFMNLEGYLGVILAIATIMHTKKDINKFIKKGILGDLIIHRL